MTCCICPSDFKPSIRRLPLVFVKTILHLAFFCLFFLLGFLPVHGDELATRVVIVVNERDPDSVWIGEDYAEKRGIPSENILAIDAPTEETITRSQYIEFIHNPLQKKLFGGGWLEGLPTELKAADGRYRSIISGHRIAYLVVCRGVPLRIKHDASRVTPEMEQTLPERFRTNSASVDSELALMTGLLPSIAFIENPLFQRREPGEGELRKVIKVARLDGPTAADAIALVDSAMEGERQGLRGRAYVDLTGPHLDGTTWLAATGDQIQALGFDIQRHEPKGVFPLATRFDAPALYFGWYANDVKGPFMLDDFRFPPGAIAFHIHSFSARTVKNDSRGWVGPFVARGAAVTLGNVYEPYLQLSHRPDLFFEWLRNGGNVGDAAAYSIPAFSWQGVLVGDPLYRPFARSLDEQISGEEAAASDGLEAYAVIRRMNLLVEEGRPEEAIEAGEKALARQKHLALALAVARMKADAGDRRGAIRAVQRAGGWEPRSSMEAMLAKEGADFLSGLDAHEPALKLYRTLLQGRDLPVELKKLLLEDGLLLARRLNERGLTDDWRGELDRLSVQP